MAQVAIDHGDHEEHKNEAHQPNFPHPAIPKIPLAVRMAAAGVICNALFLVGYNTAISMFHDRFEAATIYAGVYLVFIPIGHAINNWLVFGWPEEYLKNLLSNCPIAFGSIALGSATTAYLDNINFNDKAEAFVDSIMGVQEKHEEGGEFYSSLVVMAITGIFTFVGGQIVNNPDFMGKKPAAKDKKEL